MPKKGGFGQNWVNGLYYVKFNFQHDRSNFRAHWGHRTEIFSILVGILTIFWEKFSDWYDGKFKFLAGIFFMVISFEQSVTLKNLICFFRILIKKGFKCDRLFMR